MARTIKYDNSEAGRYQQCANCEYCSTGHDKCSCPIYEGYEDVRDQHLREGNCKGYRKSIG